MDEDARMRRETENAGRGALGFPKEADTLTAHYALPTVPRRDTMPVPPMTASSASVANMESLHVDDGDVLDAEHLEEDNDDTQTQVDPRFRPIGDDPTSPTLSLATQSVSAREVYRMFLESEYAPALELADELIAQGSNDPMLVTIARECRASLAALSSSSPPPSVHNDSAPSPRARQFATLEPRCVLRPPSPPMRGPRGSFASFDATTTIGELASTTGLSVEQLLGLLESFVGSLPARPQR
jgi:hypothetical protein